MDEITDAEQDGYEAQQTRDLEYLALQERAAAQEQVQRDYLQQIEILRSQLRTAQREAKRVSLLEAGYKSVAEELELYRALVKGWPAGRTIIERLTRNPADDDENYEPSIPHEGIDWH